MCGRFVVATPMMTIFEYFDIHDPRIDTLPPRYNVAPTTPIAIVRDTGEARIAETAGAAEDIEATLAADPDAMAAAVAVEAVIALPLPEVRELAPSQLRAELLSIRELLVV